MLPGGRILKPWGTELETGPSPFGLALSRKGTVATADIGYERFGVTVIQPPGRSWKIDHIWARTPESKAPERADPEWRSVAEGIAFESDKTVWISEGDSGKVRLIDTASGDTRAVVSLEQSAVAVQLHRGPRIRFHPPYSLYRRSDQFPRCGSRRAKAKARRLVDPRRPIPVRHRSFAGYQDRLGDGGRIEFQFVQSILTIRASQVNPIAHPEPETIAAPPVCWRTDGSRALFVSNARADSISVISAHDRKVVAEIPSSHYRPRHVPGHRACRVGIRPRVQMAAGCRSWNQRRRCGRPRKKEAIGHIPVGWMPTRVAISGDRVYVANARGRGTGPNLRRTLFDLGEVPSLHRGSVTTFIVPTAADLAKQTQVVLAANGFLADPHDAPKLPDAIKYVVLIVKQNRSFDEVFGDMPNALASPTLWHVSACTATEASGGRGQFSVQDAPVTPNQHIAARQWAFSDNFYADGDTSVEERSLADGRSSRSCGRGRDGSPSRVDDGATPDDLSLTGTLWHHLEQNGIAFREFDPNVSDQSRADSVHR